MMIETNDLTKHYGDLTAVDGINLEVEKGSIHGFVGPNGAGKTTSMQMLVGLLTPSSGEAFIDGEPAGTIAAKQKIGYSPQEPAFYATMTGREYLEYMGRTAGMGGGVTDRAAELMEWLSLGDAMEQRIGEYSSGMQRRLSLAQAMIHNPELLILDEPTAALDPEGRQAIISSLQDLTDEGMTVFVSSHVLAELEKFIDTVTILHDGRLAEKGPVKEVQSKYGGQAFVVEASDTAALADRLDEQDWVSNVQSQDDGSLVVTTDNPDEFPTKLQSLMADEGIVLESLQQKGGLEEAFADVIEQDTEVKDQ